MATQDQMRDDEAAYAAAFDEEMQAQPEASEDEAFGITPEAEDAPASSDAATEGEPAAVALVVDGEAMEDEAGQAMADATADEASAQPGEEDEGPLDPKEEQRRKSWEGRLRAREEELARREAEMNARGKPAEPAESSESEAIEEAAATLAEDGDEQGAEAVEEVADKVESGELTADQAMKILAEDFGPEFVKMIEAIASSKAEAAGRQIAEQATSALGQSVQEIIDNIVDDRARSHFEKIADAHPDFDQIAGTPEFTEFAKAYPDGERIAEAGNARQIIKMLNEFKASSKKEEAPDPAVDAAEGVRSSGMRLPQQPTKASGYEDAWDQF
jgi:DNA-binding TFAR19-related protein (PDSD5 family)